MDTMNFRKIVRGGSVNINLNKGMRRVALLFGMAGALFGGYRSYSHLQSMTLNNGYEALERFQRAGNAERGQQIMRAASAHDECLQEARNRTQQTEWDSATPVKSNSKCDVVDPFTGEDIHRADSLVVDPVTGEYIQQPVADKWDKYLEKPPAPMSLPPQYGTDAFKAAVHSQMLGIDLELGAC